MKTKPSQLARLLSLNAEGVNAFTNKDVPGFEVYRAVVDAYEKSCADYAGATWAENVEAERLKYEGSLFEFFKRAWQEFDPSPLKVGAHHWLICQHLEGISRGEFTANNYRKFLCNVPPRTGKTSLINICWPAWIWTQREIAPLSGPQVRFMCISYGDKLAKDIARTARRLILSPWYQQLWGERVQILDDQSGIDNFANTAGGVRIATSMSGATLGRGGDLRILDDPHQLDEAESELQRVKVVTTYDEALATRETDPSTSVEVTVMQRIHDADLSGHIISTSGPELVHLCLPMRYDIERHCQTPWGEDWRREDGEMLWPEQFPDKIVADRERRMGPYACNPGEAPILMADLTDRQIRDIRAGDQVVGFSKEPDVERDGDPALRRKRLMVATVKAVHQRVAPVVKITLSSGRVIRCTPDHRWYKRKRSPSDNGKRSEYSPAAVGSKLRRVCDPFLPVLEGNDLRRAGWLGGFFDGEGSVSLQKKTGGYRPSASIAFYQGAGRNLPLCNLLEDTLDYFGLPWTKYEFIRSDRKNGDTSYMNRYYRLASKNTINVYRKFLHIAKPNKWRERIIEGAFKSKFLGEGETVLSIEPDGDELVYALETTTGNYVVWGLASSNSAGQYQQSPVPRGGGIIEKDWWQVWPEVPPPLGQPVQLPDVSFVLVSLDTAISEEEQASYNACTVWGIWHRAPNAPRTQRVTDSGADMRGVFADRAGMVERAFLIPEWVGRLPQSEQEEWLKQRREKTLRYTPTNYAHDLRDEEQPRIILMEAWRRRCRLHDPTLGPDGQPKGLVERVLDTARRRHANALVIENKTRGKDVQQELQRMMRAAEFGVHLFEPRKHGDKVSRLLSVQPLFTGGLVYAPVAYDPVTGEQQEFRWCQSVISEIAQVPKGQFNDLADSSSQGLIWLREAGLILLTEEHIQEQLESRAFRPKRESVAQHYGV